MRAPWTLGALAAIALACAGRKESAPEAARAAPPPPAPAVAPDAGPEPVNADAGSVAEPPRLASMPAELELSETRAALAEELARARWVVRGKVREAREVVEQRPGAAVRYHYAVIDVLEWIVGDAKGVHKAYRKSFPIWNVPIPVMVNKSPAESHRDPALELVGRAGEERLFLVNLPTEDNLSWGEPGPPPNILRRWGKYSVAVQAHLGLDARGELAATRKDLERRATWIQENAERLQVRDRFQGASSEAVARSVADFSVAQLRSQAKLRTELGVPTQSVAGDLDVVRFPLTGDAEATGTLVVSVSQTTGRVQRFHLDVPVVKQAPAGADKSSELMLDALRSALGLQSESGRLFGSASQSSRGDGLTYWRVVLHAGTLHGARLGAPGRTVTLSATRGTGVVFDYSNAWAKAAPATPEAPESP